MKREFRPFLEAARQNLMQPPREFTDLALRMAKGSLGFFEGARRELGRGGCRHKAPSSSPNSRQTERSRDCGISARRNLARDRPEAPIDGRYAIGKDLFLAKLKTEEMVEVPLDELLAKGEANLEKDYQAFVATARRIDPKKTPAEVMKLLSDDHPTAEDLIPSVRRSVEEARRLPGRQRDRHGAIRGAPLIEETPPYARAGRSPRWTRPDRTRPARPRRFITSLRSRKTGTRSTSRNTSGSTTRRSWR